jgi:hypothetical protein
MVGARGVHDRKTARSSVRFEVDFDRAGVDGSLERSMVALGLVGVSNGEIAHRFLEGVAGAEMTGNQPRMAGRSSGSVWR